jgi:hypothetical protein
MKNQKWNGGTVERPRARTGACAGVRGNNFTRAYVRDKSHRSTVPSFQRVFYLLRFNGLGVERHWNGGTIDRSTCGKPVKYWGETR